MSSFVVDIGGDATGLERATKASEKALASVTDEAQRGAIIRKQVEADIAGAAEKSARAQLAAGQITEDAYRKVREESIKANVSLRTTSAEAIKSQADIEKAMKSRAETAAQTERDQRKQAAETAAAVARAEEEKRKQAEQTQSEYEGNLQQQAAATRRFHDGAGKAAKQGADQIRKSSDEAGKSLEGIGKIAVSLVSFEKLLGLTKAIAAEMQRAANETQKLLEAQAQLAAKSGDPETALQAAIGRGGITGKRATKAMEDILAARPAEDRSEVTGQAAKAIASGSKAGLGAGAVVEAIKQLKDFGGGVEGLQQLIDSLGTEASTLSAGDLASLTRRSINAGGASSALGRTQAKEGNRLETLRTVLSVTSDEDFAKPRTAAAQAAQEARARERADQDRALTTQGRIEQETAVEIARRSQAAQENLNRSSMTTKILGNVAGIALNAFGTQSDAERTLSVADLLGVETTRQPIEVIIRQDNTAASPLSPVNR